MPFQMTTFSRISMANLSWDIPKYELVRFATKKHKYALVIPVINEGERIRNQLKSIAAHEFPIDIIIADGGSTDGSMEPGLLNSVSTTALLVKVGRGKLSSQLRIAYSWCLQEGYDGIITIDGNGKDDLDAICEFAKKLDQGYDYVQGSRYIYGGRSINTPWERSLANRLLHAPLLSLAGRHWFSDTTNGYRAYSSRYLLDERVQPFREVFENYELLFYLTIRAGQIGMKVCQIPVVRVYPGKGSPVPTKINGILGLAKVLCQTISAAKGDFAPQTEDYKKGAMRSLWPLALLSLMCALVLPALFLGHEGVGGLASDAIEFHLPQVEEFRKSPFNLFGYQPTATTLPLYHFTLGLTSVAFDLGMVSNHTTPIRLLHFSISVLGPYLLYRSIFTRQQAPIAFLLSLPVATSFYILSGALYFGTDGPGFSLFLMAILCYSGSSINFYGASFWTLILSATRHLYFPGLVGAAIAGLFKARHVSRSSLKILVVIIPASVLLLVFFLHWGGTTPPGEVSKLNPKGFFGHSILGQLGIFGMWGFSYALIIWEKVVETYRTLYARVLFYCLAMLTLLLWGMSDTTASDAQGRFGSLIWRFQSPVVLGEKSLTVLVMALVGAGVIAFYLSCSKRYALDRVPIVAASVTVFSLGLTYAAFQRYSEPVIIGCLSLMNTSLAAASSRNYLRYIPLVAMSAIGLLTFIAKVYL